jgi:hypothetical protein
MPLNTNIFLSEEYINNLGSKDESLIISGKGDWRLPTQTERIPISSTASLDFSVNPRQLVDNSVTFDKGLEGSTFTITDVRAGIISGEFIIETVLDDNTIISNSDLITTGQYNDVEYNVVIIQPLSGNKASKILYGDGIFKTPMFTYSNKTLFEGQSVVFNSVTALEMKDYNNTIIDFTQLDVQAGDKLIINGSELEISSKSGTVITLTSEHGLQTSYNKWSIVRTGSYSIEHGINGKRNFLSGDGTFKRLENFTFNKSITSNDGVWNAIIDDDAFTSNSSEFTAEDVGNYLQISNGSLAGEKLRILEILSPVSVRLDFTFTGSETNVEFTVEKLTEFNFTTSGDGSQFLANDGSYQPIVNFSPPVDQGADNFLAGDGTYKNVSTLFSPPTDQGAGNFLAGDGTYKQAIPTNQGSATFLCGDGTYKIPDTTDSIPDQSGNSGKYITTDGSNLIWGVVDGILPDTTGQDSKVLKVTGSVANWGALTYSDISDFNTGVANSTAVGDLQTDSHTHSNKTLLDSLIDSGQANAFLNAEGNYVQIDSGDALPSQTGNDGKVLTTDGSEPAWTDLKTVNGETITGSGDIVVSGTLPSQSGENGKFLTTDGTNPLWTDTLGDITVTSLTTTAPSVFTISSPSSIALEAPDGIRVQNGPFSPPLLTTIERDALTAQNGMMIYNTTLNKFQGYQNGSWINLDGTV